MSSTLITVGLLLTPQALFTTLVGKVVNQPPPLSSAPISGTDFAHARYKLFMRASTAFWPAFIGNIESNDVVLFPAKRSDRVFFCHAIIATHGRTQLVTCCQLVKGKVRKKWQLTVPDNTPHAPRLVGTLNKFIFSRYEAMVTHPPRPAVADLKAVQSYVAYLIQPGGGLVVSLVPPNGQMKTQRGYNTAGDFYEKQGLPSSTLDQ